MKIVFYGFLFLVIAHKTLSQKNENSFEAFDIAIASGKKGFSPAMSYEKLFGLGQKGKLKLGYGLRYTGYFAQEKKMNFRTAPASLTSGKSSLAALFSEDIDSQIDTLQLDNVQTNALNLTIRLGYSIAKKIEVGFNIDAIGFTFGKKQRGIFVGNETDSDGKSNNGKSVIASPTKFNLLLISDSDIGSLNSEIFARYFISEKIGIRAGASFQFLEYTADKKLAFDNDRYRSKQLLPFVALSIKF
ncbi:MAG: hypothetical protein V4683_00775 [Bacteroidota bacterium]